MWKKALPIIGLSGILLVGCNNNGDVQNNNETPMQDVQENTDQQNNNGNNGNGNNNGSKTNGLGNNSNENNNNSQVETIEDLNRKNDVEE